MAQLPVHTDGNVRVDPEKAGVAFLTLRKETEINGQKVELVVNLTSRMDSAQEALDDLMATIGYAAGEYGLMPYYEHKGWGGKKQDTEVKQPSTAGSTAQSDDAKEWFEVTEIAFQYSKNGKPYLAVFGGWFKKFGLAIWSEAVPPETAKVFTTWEVGKRIPPPPDCKYVLVQGKKALKLSSTAE